MLHLKHSGSLVLAAALFTAPGNIANAQVYPSSAGNIAVRTFAKGLDHPWALAFLPDGRMLVTERPGRMRIVGTRRQAFAGAGGRAASLRVRPGRPARRHARPRLRRQPHDLFLLRRAGKRRRPHRAGARAAHATTSTPRLDDVKVIFRQDGPLSSGNHFGCRIVQAPRQQSVPHLGRAFHPPRRSAEPRQPSRQDRAHHARTARCRRTIRSSAAKAPSRKSGATAIAIRKARRSIPQPASCGSTSTARAAATRSTSSRRARTTAGR